MKRGPVLRHPRPPPHFILLTSLLRVFRVWSNSIRGRQPPRLLPPADLATSMPGLPSPDAQPPGRFFGPLSVLEHACRSNRAAASGVQQVISQESQEAGRLLDYENEAILHSLQHLIARSGFRHLVSPYRYVHPLLLSLEPPAGVTPFVCRYDTPEEPRRILYQELAPREPPSRVCRGLPRCFHD